MILIFYRRFLLASSDQSQTVDVHQPTEQKEIFAEQLYLDSYRIPLPALQVRRLSDQDWPMSNASNATDIVARFYQDHSYWEREKDDHRFSFSSQQLVPNVIRARLSYAIRIVWTTFAVLMSHVLHLTLSHLEDENNRFPWSIWTIRRQQHPLTFFDHDAQHVRLHHRIAFDTFYPSIPNENKNDEQ